MAEGLAGSMAEWAALSEPLTRARLRRSIHLAAAFFALGAIAWWQTGKPAFMVGALLMLAPWPWTLLALKPINDALMATDPAKAGPKTRALIVKWNRLTGVGTMLGAPAVIVSRRGPSALGPAGSARRPGAPAYRTR